MILASFIWLEHMEQLEKLKARTSSNQNREEVNALIEKQKEILASYIVAWEFAKSLKPFSDGEFVKRCLIKVAGVMSPEQKEQYEKISLSCHM